MLIKEIITPLSIIWNYMVIEKTLPFQKVDLILGCGTAGTGIAKRCSELIKQGYSNTVLFTGGFGKISKDVFSKPEAEVYREIAIQNGIDPHHIYIENQSMNTGDNFRFSAKVIQENQLKADKILIVHNKLSQRRAYNSAKVIFQQKQLSITSPFSTFEQFIDGLFQKEEEKAYNHICVIVGDVQRLVIYPSFGWQIEEIVPEEVIDAYQCLKKMGYDKYIYKKEDIQRLINQYGLAKGKEPNYFC